MSRAQSRDISNQALSNSQTAGARAGEAFNPLFGSLTSELANPGYTAAEKNAITGATTGGVGAAFGSAAEGAANRAARSNNAAGLGSQMDALARQRMITSGQLGAENETNFANNREQQLLRAQQGLGSLFGQNLTGQNQALGTSEQAAAASPSFLDQFGGAFAKALGSAIIPSASFNAGGASIGFG